MTTMALGAEPLSRLREWRERRSLSIRELAVAAGVATETIVRIEKGLPTRLPTRRKLAEALGVEPRELLGGAGEAGLTTPAEPLPRPEPAGDELDLLADPYRPYEPEEAERARRAEAEYRERARRELGDGPG